MEKSKKKLQTKIDELEKLSSYFTKTDDIDLEIAVDKYEKAAKLVSEIKSDLKKIELKIKEIQKDYEVDEDF
jgi:exonuclease VII small subunit